MICTTLLELSDKSFSFSAQCSDLYHSALSDKSFSFSAESNDLYHSALLIKYFRLALGSIFA